MPKTEVSSEQIRNNDVWREDLNVTESGKSVITNIKIAGAGLTETHTGADKGTGEVELTLNSGGFGTAYYPFTKDAIQLTTDNGWVQYDLVQTGMIPAGVYVIHFAGELTNSQKKTLGFQVNWKLDGITAYETVHESFKDPTTANIYETRAAFKEIIVPQDGVVSVQINFGFTTGGGTAAIKEHDIYLFKVAELP